MALATWRNPPSVYAFGIRFLTQLRACPDGQQGRVVACFSAEGQVLLILDQPRWLRAGGSEGIVRDILINVGQRDDLLAALGLPAHAHCETA